MAEFNTWAWGYAIGWPVGFFVGVLWMRSRATQAAKQGGK